MQFKTPQAVVDTLRASDEVERVRGLNRSKVNDLFNGVPPVSSDEAKKINLKVNCNFGEAAVLAANARRQYTNAFMRPGRFFKVSLPLAPIEYKSRWELAITTFINRKMKQSRAYFHLLQNKFSALVAHGIAPQMWCDRNSWLPRYIAVEDLRVPTDTEISFHNLEWFGVRTHYTEGELGDVVFRDNGDSAWNKKLVAAILKAYHTKNFETSDYDWVSAPEKMAELNKQNLGYFSSDAVPTIPLWKFYYKVRDAKRDTRWKLCVVPDLGVEGADNSNTEFIAQKDTWATELEHILHVQFGDLNNKAPHLYHSVRSLGFLLMEPCFWSNMLTCRNLQHTFESFNIWLRASDPVGRQRAQKVELYDQCVVPEGVSIVPQNERHQIDPSLVKEAKSQMRQFMAEAAASYVQSPDTGTQREQTAYETAVKMSQVNAMMGGLLMSAFFQETFAYKEICRRFCLEDSEDEDAEKFQAHCRRLGIPRHILNVEHWDIAPEIPLGSGNPTMEMAQVGQLMANREKFNPVAQNEILHDFVSAVSNDSAKADRLAPLEGDRLSDATRDAEAIFGTLMQGVPVHDRPELNPIDQIEALLGMLGTAVSQVSQTTNLATPQQLTGFMAVSQHLDKLLQRLSANPLERQRVKQYADLKGEIDNELKGFAQRLQEQAQAGQQGGDGGAAAAEHAAKLQSMILQSQAKANVQEAKANLQLEQKQDAFDAEQQRKNVQTAAEVERKRLLAEVDAEVARKKAEMRPAKAE